VLGEADITSAVIRRTRLLSAIWFFCRLFGLLLILILVVHRVLLLKELKTETPSEKEGVGIK
jgi:hypothetical protein